MDWRKQLKRIRRFLRDPAGNIWSDSLILRLFNNSLLNLPDNILVMVQATPVPSEFQMSFMHDFEWAYSQHDQGYVYQCFYHSEQFDHVCTYRWEMAMLAGHTGEDIIDTGYAYTHPWEAFIVQPNKPAPVWCGNRLEKIKFLAFDRDPIDHLGLRAVQLDDPTWDTHGGEPVAYRREDTQGDMLYLYPQPTVTGWHEDSSETILTDSGTDQFDVLSDLGILLGDSGEIVDSSDFGATFSYVEADNNLLAVFSRRPAALSGGADDECELPEYLQKYVEYEVLERAYLTNTDGRIESLSQYWGQKKELAKKTIAIYLQKRSVDRVLRFKTQADPLKRIRRRPRLPDTYPDRW